MSLIVSFAFVCRCHRVRRIYFCWVSVWCLKTSVCFCTYADLIFGIEKSCPLKCFLIAGNFFLSLELKELAHQNVFEQWAIFFEIWNCKNLPTKMFLDSGQPFFSIRLCQYIFLLTNKLEKTCPRKCFWIVGNFFFTFKSLLVYFTYVQIEENKTLSRT